MDLNFRLWSRSITLLGAGIEGFLRPVGHPAKTRVDDWGFLEQNALVNIINFGRQKDFFVG